MSQKSQKFHCTVYLYLLFIIAALYQKHISDIYVKKIMSFEVELDEPHKNLLLEQDR